MTRATLAQVLGPALRDGYAVPGFVCLGWEDARAFVRAAEDLRAPVILQAGPGARAHTPLPVWGAMFRHLADAASVPVVLHLDHATRAEDCRAALEEGFTSVMYDGSRLPIAENIANTAAVVAMAHAAGASCEGEVGFVGYAAGEGSAMTEAAEAGIFARETGVDALAVSVGNLHLQTEAAAVIDRARLDAVQAAAPLPLVLHGGSGIPAAVRAELSADTRVCKFNIGTELRMAFGQSLRDAMAANPGQFDRIALLSATEAPLQAAAALILRNLGAAGRA